MSYNKYFASMNTGSGFKSYFDTIFNPAKLERLFIIKGGSGTGKSTLMRKIGEWFEEKGNKVEEFHCSADINSLDGILIDKKVAVIDGTAPHVTDPKFPGAVDEIVELGELLDCDALMKFRREIIEKVTAKTNFYKKGYSFLSAAKIMKNEMRNTISENFKYDKMSQAITRYLKQNNLKGSGAESEVRLVSCIGCHGEEGFDTFERNSEKICCVTNARGCEGIFFEEFLRCATKQGLKSVVSFDPVCSDEINALYFPEVKTCVVLKGESNYYDEKYKTFNMERFIDKNILSENRAKLRFVNKCCKKLIEGASDAFLDAKKEHEKIEKIYRGNVNFEKSDEIAEKMISKIDKLLNP